MVVGIIGSNYILLHPIGLIRCFGFRRYLHLVAMCLDRAPHCLVDLVRFS